MYNLVYLFYFFMTNVKKFFYKNCDECNDFDDVEFVQSAEDEAIEIKLIKQKSQGLIAGYRYNFYRNLWNVKCNNGVECDCILNDDAECYGDVRFTYKNQSVRKYFAQPESLANAGAMVFDELLAMYQEELAEIEAKKNEENPEILNSNMFDLTMDVLAVA